MLYVRAMCDFTLACATRQVRERRRSDGGVKNQRTRSESRQLASILDENVDAEPSSSVADVLTTDTESGCERGVVELESVGDGLCASTSEVDAKFAACSKSVCTGSAFSTEDASELVDPWVALAESSSSVVSSSVPALGT